MEWVPVEGRVVHTIGWYRERYGEENALQMMLREQVAPERSNMFVENEEEDAPHTTPERRLRHALPLEASPQTKPSASKVEGGDEQYRRNRRLFADLLNDYSRHGVSGNEWECTDATFTSFPLPGTFRVAY